MVPPLFLCFFVPGVLYLQMYLRANLINRCNTEAVGRIRITTLFYYALDTMVLVMIVRVVLFSIPFKYWDCGRCEVPAPCIFANKNALWLESALSDSPKPVYEL